MTHDADPVATVIFWVTLIFLSSIIGRNIALRLSQPGVLGELLMGVFVGNLGYYFGMDLIYVLREGTNIFSITGDVLAGTPLASAVAKIISNPQYASQLTSALGGNHGSDLLKVVYVVDVFSRYGVIFLLFLVGAESSLQELRHTGRESLYVALIGVLAPMILGFVVLCLLLPNLSIHADLFIAATLSATSIGITARALGELGLLKMRESKTILGAAMIDDVLGLIILAIVSSLVISGAIDFLKVGHIIVSSVLFFSAALLFGSFVLKKLADFFSFFDPWEEKLFISFVFMMGLSWLATCAQLASIIGAFSAGIIIHDGYFRKDKSDPRNALTIRELLSPLEAILAPLFFILIGIQVKLEALIHWQVLFIAFALIVAAIVGKLLSGLGASRKSDRLLIGIGMLPRGEVGLVFASIGRTLGVITDELFSAVILMVIMTTLIAPVWLKIRYVKHAS
jgi:Kef-type K+ transport system membrane component KefB